MFWLRFLSFFFFFFSKNVTSCILIKLKRKLRTTVEMFDTWERIWGYVQVLSCSFHFPRTVIMRKRKNPQPRSEESYYPPSKCRRTDGDVSISLIFYCTVVCFAQLNLVKLTSGVLLAQKSGTTRYLYYVLLLVRLFLRGP